MVDNFPCISWPMGTGTLEHDTATVLPTANRARFLQLCQIQGRTNVFPDGYLVVIGKRIVDTTSLSADG